MVEEIFPERKHKFLDSGFIDTFRHLNPEDQRYSWWTYRFNARKNNKGWRIDYQVVTPGLAKLVRAAKIYKDKRFSDHAPLVIDYDYTLPDGD